jgi:hypothetical protein
VLAQVEPHGFHLQPHLFPHVAVPSH